MSEEATLIPGLTEGRMVHYVLDDDTRKPGEHRPAIVLNVWNKNIPGTSNLVVFYDGSNDVLEVMENGQRVTTMMDWKTSVNYSEENEPGTWHFIEAA